MDEIVVNCDGNSYPHKKHATYNPPVHVRYKFIKYEEELFKRLEMIRTHKYLYGLKLINMYVLYEHIYIYMFKHYTICIGIYTHNHIYKLTNP